MAVEDPEVLHTFKIKPITGGNEDFFQIQLRLIRGTVNYHSREFNVHITLQTKGVADFDKWYNDIFECWESSEQITLNYASHVLHEIAGYAVDALRGDAVWDTETQERFRKTVEKLIVAADKATIRVSARVRLGYSCCVFQGCWMPLISNCIR
jgi:hypothetical protein